MTRESDTSTQAEERTFLQKFGIPAIAGAVSGFISVFLVTLYMDSGALGDLDRSREIAMLVAVLYFITSLSVLVGAASPSFGSHFLNVEDADELREQRAMLCYSASGMFALGIALVLAALARPIGPVPAGVAIAGFAAMMVLAAFTSARQMGLMDELMKAVSTETAAMTFYLLFLVGGTWTLLGHVEWIAPPKPLDWLTMFAVLMLIASFWVTGKRGMLNRR